jgi:hypothetical protein
VVNRSDEKAKRVPPKASFVQNHNSAVGSYKKPSTIPKSTVRDRSADHPASINSDYGLKENLNSASNNVKDQMM